MRVFLIGVCEHAHTGAAAHVLLQAHLGGPTHGPYSLSLDARPPAAPGVVPGPARRRCAGRGAAGRLHQPHAQRERRPARDRGQHHVRPRAQPRHPHAQQPARVRALQRHGAGHVRVLERRPHGDARALRPFQGGRAGGGEPGPDDRGRRRVPPALGRLRVRVLRGRRAQPAGLHPDPDAQRAQRQQQRHARLRRAGLRPQPRRVHRPGHGQRGQLRPARLHEQARRHGHLQPVPHAAHSHRAPGQPQRAGTSTTTARPTP